MRMLFLPVVRHISSSCAVTHPAFLSQTSNGHMVHFLEPVSFDPSTAMENGLHCMEVIRAALKCADSVPFTNMLSWSVPMHALVQFYFQEKYPGIKD